MAMSKKIARPGLLSELADKSGCNYISDLRSPAFRAELRRQLQSIEAGEFSLAEWLDAQSYLIGEKSGLTRAEDIREAIIKVLD